MPEMYRGASPIFDVPEFPSLRRVKPLPKRRRMAQIHNDTSAGDINAGTDGGGNRRSATASLGLGFGLAMGLALPGPDATAEELLAHADTLSAQLALQSYYMPILGGVQDLFRADIDSGRATIDFGVGTGYGGVGVNTSASAVVDGRTQQQQQQQDEDDRDDGDYVDHLQQPGNTKKRKVPTNVSGSQHGRDTGSGQSGAEDEVTDRTIPVGRPEIDLTESLLPAFASAAAVGTATSAAAATIFGSRRSKISPATLAGLQHKEMLKNRKRQLAAVLGALSHGDTLALDQALSASLPFMTAGLGDLRSLTPPKIRLSRRKGPRRARAARLLGNSVRARHPDAAAFPSCEFTFVYPSATSDRLVATKAEVAQLRSRFEAELARQATKAAKLAAASKLMAAFPPKGTRAKHSGRTQQRKRTNGNKEGEASENIDPSGLGTKPLGKKKKRSTLANAANPHHLKNYVPSRLPHSGQTAAGQGNVQSQNLLCPPPVRFLSAEIPPRRRRKKPHVTPTSLPTNPMDEWVCVLCYFRLFYSGEQEYERAVRMRKKVLRRRRRARERAAEAASGNKVTDRVAQNNHGEYEDGGFEPLAASVPKPPAKMKWGEKCVGGENGSFG